MQCRVWSLWEILSKVFSIGTSGLREKYIIWINCAIIIAVMIFINAIIESEEATYPLNNM